MDLVIFNGFQKVESLEAKLMEDELPEAKFPEDEFPEDEFPEDELLEAKLLEAKLPEDELLINSLSDTSNEDGGKSITVLLNIPIENYGIPLSSVCFFEEIKASNGQLATVFQDYLKLSEHIFSDKDPFAIYVAEKMKFSEKNCRPYTKSFLSFIEGTELHEKLLSVISTLLKTKGYANGNKKKRDRYRSMFKIHIENMFHEAVKKKGFTTKIDFLKLYYEIFQKRICLLEKYTYSPERSQSQAKKTSVKVPQIVGLVQREVFNAELHNLDFRQMISCLHFTPEQLVDINGLHREKIVRVLRPFSSVAPGKGRIEESCCGILWCDGSYCGRTYVRTMEHIKYNNTKLEEIHCVIQGILYPDEGPELK